MGRKSALTADQWLEIERRHLVDGVSINSLAAEYKINESSIRRRIKPNNAEEGNTRNPLISLAQAKLEADAEAKRIAEQIAELPYARQQIVFDIEQQMRDIGRHMLSAGAISASSVHKLSQMARNQLERVDDVDPDKTLETLQCASRLQNMANTFSVVPFSLMKAFKDGAGVPDDEPTPIAIQFNTKDCRRDDGNNT